MMNLGLKLTEYLCNTFEALSSTFRYTKGGERERRGTRSSGGRELPEWTLLVLHKPTLPVNPNIQEAGDQEFQVFLSLKVSLRLA